jgi:hypothetical protein
MILLTREQLMALPTRGPAWNAIVDRANAYGGEARLSDQDSQDNNGCLAAALVYARIGHRQARAKAEEGIGIVANVAAAGSYDGSALALARNLGAFVIAADLVGARVDFYPLLSTPTTGQPSLVASHERRPNNWGLHAGFSRACVHAYMRDTWGLDECARIFRAWAGEPELHDGFSYGGPRNETDLSWQADPASPVGILPMGAKLQGTDGDGVQPEEQRRAGVFRWPPEQTVYQWEGLAAAYAQAWILWRQGYPAFDWSARALLRATDWLYRHDFEPDGDDLWVPWLCNHVYGTAYPTVSPTTPGKSIGFTCWIFGGGA